MYLLCRCMRSQKQSTQSTEMLKAETMKSLFGLLVLVLALVKVHPAAAMDVQFHVLPGCTGGLGVTCTNLTAGTCCSNVAPTLLSSVQFTYDAPMACYSDVVYKGGQCTTQAGTSTGNACLNGAYTGAKWLNTCRRRRALLGDGPEETSTKCTSLSKPNTLFYKDHESEGTYVIKMSDVTDLLLALQGVPDAEKVAWLKAQGAIYESMTQVENWTCADVLRWCRELELCSLRRNKALQLKPCKKGDPIVYRSRSILMVLESQDLENVCHLDEGNNFEERSASIESSKAQHSSA